MVHYVRVAYVILHVCGSGCCDAGPAGIVIVVVAIAVIVATIIFSFSIISIIIIITIITTIIIITITIIRRCRSGSCDAGAATSAKQESGSYDIPVLLFFFFETQRTIVSKSCALHKPGPGISAIPVLYFTILYTLYSILCAI